MNGFERIEALRVSAHVMPMTVSFASWARGPVQYIKKPKRLHAVEDSDLLGPAYFMNAKEAAPSLPVEFWNHELMELDPEDEEQGRAFIEKWGIPYHPVRNSPDVTRDELEETGVLDSERWRNQISSGISRERSSGALVGSLPKHRSANRDAFFISRKEFVSSIRLLQDFVICSLYLAVGSSKTLERYTPLDVASRAIECAAQSPLTVPRVDEQIVMLNSATRQRRVFELPWQRNGVEQVCSQGEGIGLYSVGLLTSAICWQLMDSFADGGTDWKVCANPKCGRVFKRKRPVREGANPRESIYCQESCNNAVKVKRFRQKGKVLGEAAEEAKPAR
ncbi:hypothetical protein [Slackia piriformis]|uniref:hypothetical protein n=1 Tax=Slackia piriformis TaxID=626934 RepID=UPI0023EFF936|nr:hypothetical protein [Slackia piriformis]